MKKFVHLHTHSEYSLLDGAARINDLVSKAKEFDMEAIALTDHGAMYGIIDFYEKAKAAGIKPIIGCEFYIAPRSRFERNYKKDESPYHLVLLAKNETGRKNLMKLVTLSFFEGYYYKPRLDLEILEKINKEIIALSGCIGGEIPKALLRDNYKKAEELAERYQNIFGKGNFYLELQNHGLDEQVKVNKGLIQIGKEKGIPLVATNDIHYITKKDKSSHDVLLCVQTNSMLSDKDRFEFKSDQFYLKSQEEMIELFKEHPEAITNTKEIAEKCNVEIKFEQILPFYEVPKNTTQGRHLRKLCEEGLKKRYEKTTKEIRERLDFELNVIEQMGYPSYFLIVWDVIKFAKESGIRVGPGRGSAAGSLVSYVLGITDIDPLEYGLLFERFLNPERKTLPDIDIDFSEDRRDEVIEYIAKKYGNEKVAQIITFSTLKARAATRDAGRVLGYPYGKVDRIAKLILKDTIDESLKEVPELKEIYKTDKEAQEILDTAKPIEGLVRQDSIHAAGVVISREELTNYVPLQRKGDAEIVTQFPKEIIERIGLLKMDFLGLRTLTVINNTLRLIKEKKKKDVDLDKLDLKDKKVYKLFQKGETIGVFQMESAGMRSLLKDLKPTSFEDIIAANALNRPGPLKSGMVKDFIDRKRKRKEVKYYHPLLKSVLKDTYGTIVYQEQVMGIASKLAGFSMAEADILRKAISKKEKNVWEEQKKLFIERAVKNKVQEKKASRIFDLVAPFVEYAFNKSHSTAYAILAYQTAYLKAHYSTEFMTALLTSVWGDKDKVALYVNESRRLGIKILTPDINSSQRDFSIEKDGIIRFGFSAIRNIGTSIVEEILKARADNFKSIYDFCDRVNLGTVNKRTLESLIKAGSFDSTGVSRKYCLDIYELAVERGVKKQKDRETGQFSLFQDTEDEGGTFSIPAIPPLDQQEEFAKNNFLTMEKEMLGVFITDNPLLGVESILKEKSISTSEIKDKHDASIVTCGGIISKVKKIITKKGDLMASVTVEDLEGFIDIIIFPNLFKKHEDLINEDNILLFKSKVDVKENRDASRKSEVKLIALEVMDLNTKIKKKNNNDYIKTLHLYIENTFFNSSLKDELKRVLGGNNGRSEVFVHLRESNKDTTFKLNNSFNVAINTTLIAELKAMLGEGSIRIEKN